MLQPMTCGKPRTIALIALGSNLEADSQSPADNLQASIEGLRDAGLVIRGKSRFFRSPAFPAGTGPDYVNGVIAVETDLSPTDLLAVLHAVEVEAGRVRKKRWSSRVLDLDLLAMGGVVLPDLETYDYWRELPLSEQMQLAPETLILPHPRLHERGFVLLPLADIAPDWLHPVLKLTVAEMLAKLPAAAKQGIEPL